MHQLQMIPAVARDVRFAGLLTWWLLVSRVDMLAEDHRDLAFFNLAIDSKLAWLRLDEAEGRRCHGIRSNQRARIGSAKQAPETCAL